MQERVTRVQRAALHAAPQREIWRVSAFVRPAGMDPHAFDHADMRVAAAPLTGR